MEELIDDYTYVPKDVQEDVRAACCNLLPRKSKQLYHKELEHFEQWKKKRQVIGVSEEIVLAYFHNYKNSLAPSSMWTKYSMLKSTLKVYKNIDISKYGKLISYLKMESRSHKPKKSKVLERNHMEKFLNEAPDSQYLMMKVVVIMGISGACRCDELTNLMVDFIEDKGGYLFVSIPETKTNISKSFTIVEEGFSTNILDIYRKYASLRPKNVPHSRFFLNYKNEKCTTQAVGINSISKIPQAVASFLNLPEAQLYTGHSLRRSSATLLANAGADLTTLKRHGGWKSSTVAEGYIEDSVSNKIDIAKKIQGPPSSSSCTSTFKMGDPVFSLDSPNIPCTTVNKTTTSGTTATLLQPQVETNKTMSFNFNINVNFQQ